MSIVYLHLIGANVYVPHASGSRLLAVQPNATRLGQSPDAVGDGARPATHFPVLYEEREIDGQLTIYDPKHFVGSRLTFEFSPSPPLDLSAIDPVAAQGWFEVDPAALSNSPGDGVAGQVLVTAGKVSIYGDSCSPAWYLHDLGKSLGPVVLGLTVEVPGAFRVRARRTPWVTGSPQEILYRDVAFGEIVHLYAGNLCAEDVLDWTQSSSDAQRIVDDDFKWLLGLSKATAIKDYLATHKVLPAPEVAGGPVKVSDTVAIAFSKILGGGGGAGCQCQGCVEKRTDGF